MAAAVATTILLAGGPLAAARWEAPRFAFVTIVVATGLCLVGSLVVVVVGWRRGLAEVTILGAALCGGSILPMVHGLTIPGVLYGQNQAVSVTAFVAVPVLLIVGAPMLLPRLRASIAIARHWRAWTVSWLVVFTLMSTGFLIWPDMVPAPIAGSPFVLAIVALSVAGTVALALRQMRMFRVGRRTASLVASAGFAYLGFSMLAWLGAAPFSLGWWLAHAADAAGVLGATLGLALAHRGDHDVVATLAPVVNRNPLIALELGLTPVVHQFIAALAQKDPVTRDHVVRVAELAMRCGVRAGLAPERLRALGLGALLHDIGKLNTPTEILTKPAALTDDEFEQMKRHTVWGEALMQSSPLLTPAAPFVRWHHERIDGAGYPDGLVDADIPFEARLISVCDAWDAMTSSRPYRDGMPPTKALDILHAHAGTQWGAETVALVAHEIAEAGVVVTSTFDRIGTQSSDHFAPTADDLICVCLDALPRELALS